MLPTEAIKFFKKSISAIEVLKYLLVFGGVPKYLNDIDQSKSFEQNLINLLFDKDSAYIDEYGKIFYSQFKEHQTYEKIVKYLAAGPLNLKDIAEKVNIRSGGGLRLYLQNLEMQNLLLVIQLTQRPKNPKYYIINLVIHSCVFILISLKPIIS